MQEQIDTFGVEFAQKVQQIDQGAAKAIDRPGSDHVDVAAWRGTGNDGSEPPGLHPFVQGLLKELPNAGDVWPEDQRKLWLDTAASIFKMIYKDGPNKLPPLPYTKEAAN
jgi:hypothetical protein